MLEVTLTPVNPAFFDKNSGYFVGRRHFEGSWRLETPEDRFMITVLNI
jgi:hypothetical protein